MEKAYLPAAAGLEQMSKDEFARWVHGTKLELLERAERRDPLFHLQKRISDILRNNELTEAQRELRVLWEIERFERITSQSR